MRNAVINFKQSQIREYCWSIVPSGTSYAKERCSIVSATETVSVTNIEQYQDVNKSVIQNSDGSLQCSVMFNALIGGKWYPIW